MNRIRLYHGMYVCKHLKCNSCTHVICQECDSDLINVDRSKKLVGDHVKVASFETTECPFFSVCVECGLTYRAQAKVAGGLVSSPKVSLTFKPYNEACGYCHCQISPAWLRMGIRSTSEFAGPSQNVKRAPCKLRSVIGSLRLLTSSTLRSVANRKDTEAKTPATPKRSKFDPNESIPFDYVHIGYDGERHFYRDGEGREFRTEIGSRGGPFERIC